MTTQPALAPAVTRRCAGFSYRPEMRGESPCVAPAWSLKYHEEGKDWCHHHAPSQVKRREAASQARFEAKYAVSREQNRREAAERAACDGLSTEALESGVVRDALDALEAITLEGQLQYMHVVEQARAVLRKAGRLA